MRKDEALRLAQEAFESIYVPDDIASDFIRDWWPKCREALAAIRAALVKPNLDSCPTCGGVADNGHDREYPPNPYVCTKCSKALVDTVDTTKERVDKTPECGHENLCQKSTELVEPVAWLFQHEETGLTQCVDRQQVEWGFEKNNPRWQKIRPLYDHAAPQPVKQEPVYWVVPDFAFMFPSEDAAKRYLTSIESDAKPAPCYTAPQPRHDVDLSDDELFNELKVLDASAVRLPIGFKLFARAVIAAYKEKQNGR